MRQRSTKRLLALALSALLLLSLFGCGKKPAAAASGSKSFQVVMTDLEGKETTLNLTSDKATVGEALLAEGLIAGEESSYGLYVNTVNGITLDWEKDGKYWAFYIDGEYAATGVDATDLTEGAVYSFKPE